MVIAARKMEKAQRRLSKNLGEPTVAEALTVLDKAVTGLIALAKGRVSDGASGKDIDSPFGANTSNPYGSNGYDVNISKSEEKLMGKDEAYRGSPQRVAARVKQVEGRGYEPGAPESKMGFNGSKSKKVRKAMGDGADDMAAAWDDDEGDDDEDEDKESVSERMARLRAMQGKNKKRDDDDDDRDDDDEDDDDDEEDDDDDDYGDDDDDDRDHDDDEDEDEEKGWDWAQDKGWGQQQMNRGYGRMQMGGDGNGEGDDEEGDTEEGDDDGEGEPAPRRRRDDGDDGDDEQPVNNSFARSWSVNDIHKALVSGPNGARVAEVVEASRELAHMVNIFGGIMSDISGQVGQLRRDQRNANAILADAVNTVVKSQSAIALGLERMAKSTASLAKSGASGRRDLAKSMGTSSPNPGVVMNGKVLAEGNALRRSNAMIDETGSAVVGANGLEQRLTKSLVGTVIQQAVLDGEFSAKDALRWLTETDSPASGPVAVYRQLPAKLQDRIASRANEM